MDFVIKNKHTIDILNQSNVKKGNIMSEPYRNQISEQTITEAATPISAVQGDLPENLRSKKSKDLLKEVLAMLRAQQWLYQTYHWQAKGENFYEMHLLFERLYDSVGDQIDNLAEKLVGYFGIEEVDMKDAIARTQKWINTWASDNAVDSALKAEKQFQSLLRRTYDTMNQKKELSLGLDDYLMATASDHEVALYLLGQVKG